MADLNPTQEVSLINVLTDFPNYFNNFQTNFQALLAQSSYIYAKHPELKIEYDALVTRASENYNKLVGIKDVVSKINNAGQTVGNWVKGMFGLSGLGIAPLIWGAVSAASAYAVIASTVSWLKDAKTFASRLEYIKDQEGKGKSAQQAAADANAIFGAPDTEAKFLGIPIKFVVVGAVLIFLGPPLIAAFSGRKK